MTKQELREHYAGLAMQYFLNGKWPPDQALQIVARNSIAMADALIAELACRHEKQFVLHGVSFCSHCKEKLDLE